MTQYYQDQGEYAPQGVFGSALGFAAPHIGAAIGGRFGNAGLGRQIGSVAGAFSHFIPFEAAPELPGGYYGAQGGGEYAPQGMFGNLISRALPTVGGAIGGHFGHAGIGRQIGSMAAPWAQRFIPFEAAPEMPGGYYGAQGGGEYAPQGMFGNLISRALPTVGGAIGGHFGHAGIGRQIGSMAAPWAQRFIPFEAAPELPGGYYGAQGGGEYAPQGMFGNLISRALPSVGGAIGGHFGHAGIGRQIGSMAAPWAQRFIPFEAAPELPGGYHAYA